ncbi:hypothetical protein ACB098_05G003100 [Castanea mollissima]|uniref:Uncharacterized protein n=1 Tax=Castanea mollissima TaxID=60419 RepID=A0A8J4QM31_9ROSI|nr:hypothetical protein CMV_022517 [Castanea mollissima]
MAVTCSSFSSSSIHIPILKSGLIMRPISKSLMLKHTQVPVKKLPRLQIKCSIKNKVYEDRSNGIICYRDDSGEIVCEGYDDEAPRFQQQVPRTTCHPRDVEIIDLLFQQSGYQIVKGSGLNNVDESVAVQKDLNCNGFNSFC